MLDRTKLSKQLEVVVGNSFYSAFQEVDIARKLWSKIISSVEFSEAVFNADRSWGLPQWAGNLDLKKEISANCASYTVVSVDGSQIYPDRHRGTDCFLINISEIILHYGQARSGAKLESFPYVYASEDDSGSEDLVNCKRQEMEFYHGLQLAKKVKERAPNNVILLFDGSLIFWHLQSKDEKIKNRFLAKYISILQQCADEQIILASYISLPKSKDLVNLLRFDSDNKELFEFLTDVDVVNFYLPEECRSNIFVSNAAIVQEYPKDLKPNFFYLNTGSEIARIEFPNYVAQNKAMLETLDRSILDQVKKGNGYPVALSEAHEHAVIKTHEKELFYALIGSLGKTQQNLRNSSKLTSKYYPSI